MKPSAAAGLVALLGLAAACISFNTWAQPAGRAQVLNPDLGGLHLGSSGPLLAWGSDATVWWHDSTQGRWTPAETPHHGRVRALLDQGDRLLAVGDGGLLMHASHDGRRWQHAEAPASTTGPEAPAALVDLACQGPLCLAVGGQGLLLRSDDGGLRWQAVPGAPSGALTAVRTTVATTATNHWWVGNAEGQLWHSPDGGLRWQTVWPSTPLRQGTARPAIDSLASDGQQLLMATSDGRLHSVAPDHPTPRPVFSASRGSFTRLAALPQPGAWVATGALGACAWRPAAQAAWRSCQVPRNRLLRGLASSPDGRHWVVVGENGLVMHSSNQGRAWAPVPVTGADLQRHLEAVAWSAARPGFVAVGSGGLVLRGQANGQGWQVEHSAPQHYVHDVVATRPASAQAPAALLASLSYRHLARSEDGGRNWRSHRFDALQDPAFLFALHADPVSGSMVAAGGQGSVMVAPDGRHWRHESLGHGRDYLGLLALPDTPWVLLWGTGGVVLRVDSQAAQWQAVPLPAKEPVYGAFHSPGGDAWLLGQAGLVLHSGDEGQTWQAQRIGTHTLRTGLALEEGRVLLVAGDAGTLWRASLRPAAEGAPPRQTWLQVATPAADWRWLRRSADGRSLWLGGQGGQMARSDDQGLSWSAVPLPTQAALRPPVYDAARGHWWMPGRDGTLLFSADDGAHWQAVPTHTREHLKGLWVDPQTGGLLLYGARLVRWTPGTNTPHPPAKDAP